jgi:uncharacterized protein
VNDLPYSTDQDPNRLNDLRKSVEQSIENIKIKAHQALRQSDAQLGAGDKLSIFPVLWVQELHSQVDLLAHTAQKASGSFACMEGCSSCCHARVEVTPPEVFAIANYLSAESKDRRPEVIEQLASRAKGLSINPANKSQWSARPACALLVDHRCSVYPVRPAVCRKGHSYDAQACKKGEAELPLHYGFVLGAEVWMAGVSKGYEAAGFQCPTLELGDALLKVLQNPQMQSDWLKGRSVF